MTKKRAYSQGSKTQIKSLSPQEKIAIILHSPKAEQRKLIEAQARQIWLECLFQTHTETTVTTEIEETEERQQIFGGGNPDGEIITNRTTKKVTTKVTTPKVPLWAIKAAFTLDWSMTGKFNELSAIAVCVEAGLMPESTLDLVVDYTTNFSKKVLESTVGEDKSQP